MTGEEGTMIPMSLHGHGNENGLHGVLRWNIIELDSWISSPAFTDIWHR